MSFGYRGDIAFYSKSIRRGTMPHSFYARTHTYMRENMKTKKIKSEKLKEALI